MTGGGEPWASRSTVCECASLIAVPGALSMMRICEAIMRDEKRVLPVSCQLTGQFGLAEIYLSLPCLIGAGGIERVLVPALQEGEVAALLHSAAVLHEAIAGLALTQ